MTRPRFVLALLALAALVAGRLLSTRDSPPDATDLSPEAGAPPPGSAPAPATLEASRERPVERETAPKGSPARAADVKRAVRVRVVADEPALVRGVRVVVTGRGRRGERHDSAAEGTTDDDGRVTLDVAPLLEFGWAHTFVVRAHPPDGLTAETTAAIPEADDASPPAGRFSVEVEVRVVRAAIVTGRVVRPDGTPATVLPVQALLAEDTGAAGARTFGLGVYTDPTGAFRLPVDGRGPALIAVGARGFAPPCLPVTLDPYRPVDLGTIRLERGATLAGRIRCGGLPTEGMAVAVTWYGGRNDDVRPARDGYLWVEDGHAAWSMLEAQPNTDGTFRFEGLEPGPYRLRVVPESWGCALHPDAYAQVDLIVRAPNERIEVDADRALLQVEVLMDGAKVEHAVVTVDGRDSIRLNTGTDGVVGVVLRAGRRHRVEVAARDAVPQSFDVTAAEPGGRRRERVVLVRLPDRAPRTVVPWDAPPIEPTAPGADIGNVRLVPDERPLGTGPFGCDVVGPDGVRLAAPALLRDAAGTVAGCRFVDGRPVVQVVSGERTSVGGLTIVAGCDPSKEWTLEVGGGLLETRRVPLDATNPKQRVVLRGR